jgi:hypothetical protein
MVKNGTLPIESIEKFTKLKKAVGNNCELIRVKDANHSFDWPVNNPDFLPTLQRIAALLQEQKLIK